MDWKKTSQPLSLAAAGIGVVALAGWVFRIDTFKRIHPQLVTMKPNTAVCLMLAGFAIAYLGADSVSRTKLLLARIFAGIVGITGMLTLAEHLGHWDFGIDQFLFRESTEEAGQSFPGRMGPASALNFILLALAILFMDVRSRHGPWPSQICAVMVIGITFLIFLAYFYAEESLRPIALYASIALHTVVAFWLLAVAIILARPGRGLAVPLLSNNMGGIVARRLLPAALIVPALLGWLRLIGQRSGWYDTGVGTALFTTALIIVFVVLIWGTARALGAADSARRSAEERLQRSERELTDFFDNSAFALNSVGPDGTILRANDKELEMLGLARQEYVGCYIAEFHADASVAAGMLERLTRGETLEDFPARLRRKDGSLRDVLIHSSVYREDGKFVHTRCFTRDVTDLNRAEVARIKLAAIVDSSDDAIISKNLDGLITSWNPGAERLFGYSAEEMIGQPVVRLIPPDRHGEEAMILARLRRGERIEHYETIRRTKDGREVYVSLTVSPVRDAAGRITGASKIARDITLRKASEAALRASETLKSTILDTSLDGFILMNHEGRIEDWNRTAAQIFGYSREEAIGRLLAETIVPERLREAHREGMARYLATGETRVLGRRYELPALRRDGTEFPCEISISHIPDTLPPLFAGYLRDITERKQSEAALEKARHDADAASKAKDEFLAALSHELRTPLTPVLMLSAAMEKSDELPPEVRNDFAMIRKNIELEALLIDDLLDLTRITRGKLPLHFDRVDPHLLITDSIRILLNEVEGKKIVVSIDLDAARHHVRADAVRLQQVFWNILRNAVKFTPEGGRIGIRSGNDGNEWTLAVTDTGLGITAEELPRIFDAWAQGDAAAGPRFGGLGLGLSISMHLVQQHDGRLWAESAGRGKGAAFHMALPLVPAPDPVPESIPAGPLPSPRSLRILLVEDHETSRETLARLLVRRGHAVETAGSIAQAFAAAAADSFDLVISDLGLPDGRGHELMSSLRRDFGLRGIALSGFGMQTDIAQSNQAGFDEHITKPISMTLLESAIGRIMAASGSDDAPTVP